jgi:hypothetical protein
LDNGSEITINGHSSFTFNLGGNLTTGDKGYEVAYTDLPTEFGLEGLPDKGLIDTIVDQYII